MILKVEFLAIRTKKQKEAAPVNQLEVTEEGIVGDRHFGLEKRADGRDTGIPRGTWIRNWRHWTAVAPNELAQTARLLGVDSLDPLWLTANILFSGCEQLTKLPKGSRLVFESGAILMVEGENEPCVFAGKTIAKHCPSVKPAAFPRAAKGRRGLVGVVAIPGLISLGDTATVLQSDDVLS